VTPEQEHTLEDLATDAEERVHSLLLRFIIPVPPWLRADILAILYDTALAARELAASDYREADKLPLMWNPDTDLANLLAQQQKINNLRNLRFDAATAFSAPPRTPTPRHSPPFLTQCGQTARRLLHRLLNHP